MTAAAGAAQAATILDFENIPFTQFQANWNGYDLKNTHTFAPPGYANMTWSNDFRVVKAAGFGARQPGGAPAGNGIENGLHSGEWIAINGGATPVSFKSFDGANFNLETAFMAAAWYNGLQVLVEGWRDGVKVYEMNTGGLGFDEKEIAFNWVDIDEVRFASVDGTGTVIDNQSTYNRAFVLDDLRINAVPEPVSAALLLAGIAGLGVARRRKA
jgi:hypothetical protein